MIQSNELLEMYAELKSAARLAKKARTAEKAQKEYERLQKLMNGRNFSISIFYRDSVKYDGRPTYERIELEGYDTAKTIFSAYRDIAFDIRISKMVMKLDGEKVQGVNFKYRIDG